MNPTSTLFVVLASIAIAGCTPDFAPASRVEKLRVLAVQAEPPEIAPAPASGMPVAPDRATLTSLVLRPDFATDPSRKTTVLYLACIPVPGDPTPSPCVLLAELRDPAGVVAGVAGASCAGTLTGSMAPIAFVGAEVCQSGNCGPATTSGGATPPPPVLNIPAGYGFNALPPGAPARILGVQAVVLAFALDATPDELASGAGACPAEAFATRLAALWAERDHVLATKRVWIRGPEAPDVPNQNPAISGISRMAADGVTSVDVGGTSVVGTVVLTPVVPAGRETYWELDAGGSKIQSKTEEWVYSWFGTAGEMKDLHTRDTAPDEHWDVAAAPPSRAIVAAVVRDLRGGVAWKWREATINP